MADPRWFVVLGMIAFYFSIGRVVYDGRCVASAANLSDRSHYLMHHKDSLWRLLRNTVLLLVCVIAVVTYSTAHTYSRLFWIHESLDVLFLALAALAIIFNGNRSVNHKYLGWSMVALTAPIGITGAMLLYQLPMS